MRPPTHYKCIWAALGVLLALGGCAGPAFARSDAAWLGQVVDTYFRISTQLLRLEAARDAVELEATAAGNPCDPANSKATYESVDGALDRLIGTATPLKVDAESIDALRRVRSTWATVHQRQASHWASGANMTGITPTDRCLRASDLVNNRLAIERDVKRILQSGIR